MIDLQQRCENFEFEMSHESFAKAIKIDEFLLSQLGEISLQEQARMCSSLIHNALTSGGPFTPDVLGKIFGLYRFLENNHGAISLERAEQVLTQSA